MNTASLPQCPPFGDFVSFVFDDRVEVITQSHALTQLKGDIASHVDAFAHEVEQVGLTVWKFTYCPMNWVSLCSLLGEIYAVEVCAHNLGVPASKLERVLREAISDAIDPPSCRRAGL